MIRKKINNYIKKLYQQQFNLRVNLVEGDIFDIENYIVLKQINSSKNFFSIHPKVIIADPFVLISDDLLYIFYEEQTDLDGKGLIKMIKTSDLKKWSKPIVVLKEKFHLSFPYIFKIDEKIFMMPESGHDNSVRLYVPEDNFKVWTLYKIILEGKRFTDSSIIYHQKCYYLFTTDYSNETNVLRLFYSEAIDYEWTEHPKSPIAIGVNKGRCAGSVFCYNNKLFRPSQRSELIYGGGVDIYTINKLTKNDYFEEKFLNLIPNSDNFYKLGGHHFNACKFKGKQIVVTDGLENRLNLLEIFRRLKYKFF